MRERERGGERKRRRKRRKILRAVLYDAALRGFRIMSRAKVLEKVAIVVTAV